MKRGPSDGAEEGAGRGAARKSVFQIHAERKDDPDDLPVYAVLWSDHRMDGYTDLWFSESGWQSAGNGLKGG